MSNSSGPITKCFPPHQLVLMTDLEKHINNYVFPIQFLITVVGNLLTMSVLLNRNMKNRANHLLACLAFCDIFVFVMMFPHYLSSIEVLSDTVDFRRFHYHTKVHFAALSNWFSAAAIWFVLAVSLERLLIIKYPFRSLDGYNIKHIIFVSFGIFAGTFLLTSYHHVSHTCLSWVVCNGTQSIGSCYPNMLDSFGKRPNPTSALTKQWINISLYLNAAFAVLLPILAVAIINIQLIRLLKQRNGEELMQRSVNPSSIHDQERKMTNTVLAIVTCFSFTQGPSALVYCIQHLHIQIPCMREISVVASQLVLTGKMLNVVLFCLTSGAFRKKLLYTCKIWATVILYCNRNKARSRFSREQSKSVVTQKTSIMYSPSAKNFSHRRISAYSEQISLNNLTKKENEQSLQNTDRTTGSD